MAILHTLYRTMQPASPICKNCGRPLSADVDFCPACGSSAHTHRLGMHHILHDLGHVGASSNPAGETVSKNIMAR